MAHTDREKRVESMLLFVQGMEQKREEVVRLLMWEIGKTRKDAEKNSTARCSTSTTPWKSSRM